jgi:hypothetical protein
MTGHADKLVDRCVFVAAADAEPLGDVLDALADVLIDFGGEQDATPAANADSRPDASRERGPRLSDRVESPQPEPSAEERESEADGEC